MMWCNNMYMQLFLYISIRWITLSLIFVIIFCMCMFKVKNLFTLCVYIINFNICQDTSFLKTRFLIFLGHEFEWTVHQELFNELIPYLDVSGWSHLCIKKKNYDPALINLFGFWHLKWKKYEMIRVNIIHRFEI